MTSWNSDMRPRALGNVTGAIKMQVPVAYWSYIAAPECVIRFALVAIDKRSLSHSFAVSSMIQGNGVLTAIWRA